jgi:hypothetical protein
LTGTVVVVVTLALGAGAVGLRAARGLGTALARGAIDAGAALRTTLRATLEGGRLRAGATRAVQVRPATIATVLAERRSVELAALEPLLEQLTQALHVLTKMQRRAASGALRATEAEAAGNAKATAAEKLTASLQRAASLTTVELLTASLPGAASGLTTAATLETAASLHPGRSLATTVLGLWPARSARTPGAPVELRAIVVVVIAVGSATRTAVGGWAGATVVVAITGAVAVIVAVTVAVATAVTIVVAIDLPLSLRAAFTARGAGAPVLRVDGSNAEQSAEGKGPYDSVEVFHGGLLKKRCCDR